VVASTRGVIVNRTQGRCDASGIGEQGLQGGTDRVEHLVVGKGFASRDDLGASQYGGDPGWASHLQGRPAQSGGRHDLPCRDDLTGVQQLRPRGHVLTSPTNVLAAVDPPADQDLAALLGGVLEHDHGIRAGRHRGSSGDWAGAADR
jgi:hypothetical protein